MNCCMYAILLTSEDVAFVEQDLCTCEKYCLGRGASPSWYTCRRRQDRQMRASVCHQLFRSPGWGSATSLARSAACGSAPTCSSLAMTPGCSSGATRFYNGPSCLPRLTLCLREPSPFRGLPTPYSLPSPSYCSIDWSCLPQSCMCCKIQPGQRGYQDWSGWMLTKVLSFQT